MQYLSYQIGRGSCVISIFNYQFPSPIKCVYAYELSRIGRRPEVNYNIRNFLQEHRVQLIILSPYMKVFDDDFNIIETLSL